MRAAARIDQTKLRALPSSDIEFLVSVGEAGLKMWRGSRQQVAQIKAHLTTMRDELKRRARGKD